MGSNGLDTLKQWYEGQKCPEAPTKKRYRNSDEAWNAAKLRSQETGLEIAAYLCPGCGGAHLTKKVNGSDIVVKDGDGISTGALRKNRPLNEYVPTGRVELPNETPIIPGNANARSKALSEFLKDRDTVTGQEAMKVLGITATSSLGRYMRELGWDVVSHGRSAYWTKKRDVVKPIVPIRDVDRFGRTQTEQSADPVVASIARHPAGKSWRDVDLKTLPPISLLELLNTYSAAGLTMRIQVSDK